MKRLLIVSLLFVGCASTSGVCKDRLWPQAAHCVETCAKAESLDLGCDRSCAERWQADLDACLASR
jgi:hypothetical protein